MIWILIMIGKKALIRKRLDKMVTMKTKMHISLWPQLRTSKVLMKQQVPDLILRLSNVKLVGNLSQAMTTFLTGKYWYCWSSSSELTRPHINADNSSLKDFEFRKAGDFLARWWRKNTISSRDGPTGYNSDPASQELKMRSTGAWGKVFQGKSDM